MDVPISMELRSRQLTPRQVEIVQLVVGGRTARQIGGLLGLSTRTVEGHLHQARQRVGASTVAELVAWAVAVGIVSPRLAFSVDAAEEIDEHHPIGTPEKSGRDNS